MYVQPTIFYDLAHDAVSLRHASLLSAADSVRAKSASNGQLFLVRHLLILREITSNMNLAQKDEPQVCGGFGGADQYGVAGVCRLSNPRTLGARRSMILDPASQTRYPLSCRARQPSFLVHSSST
jgi:conserved oligomeric Golgi complex subunit 3